MDLPLFSQNKLGVLKKIGDSLGVSTNLVKFFYFWDIVFKLSWESDWDLIGGPCPRGNIEDFN